MRLWPAPTCRATAYVLAEALKTFQWDLVLFGVRSTDGETGCVPAAVAERLGVPLLSTLAKVEVRGLHSHGPPGDRAGLRGVRMPHSGRPLRYQGHQRAPVPVDEGHHGRQEEAAGAKDSSALSLDQSQIGLAGAKTRVLSARSPEPRKAGVKIEDDGTGAQKIAEFLASAKLV